MQHAGNPVREEDVLDQAASDVHADPLEPALARVSGDQQICAAGVADLEGEPEGRQVEEVRRVRQNEADEPRSGGGVDVRALRKEGRHPPRRHVGRALRQLEVQPWDEHVALRRRHGFETSRHWYLLLQHDLFILLRRAHGFASARTLRAASMTLSLPLTRPLAPPSGVAC